MNDEWKSKSCYSRLKEDEKAGIKTERQWALDGFVPIDKEAGALMYSNMYQVALYHYYSSEEVRKGTKQEIASFFAPEKERKRERAAEKRAIKAIERSHHRYHLLCERNAKAVYAPSAPGRTVVLDIETTGLDNYRDEILQLAIIDADSRDVIYNQFFKPFTAVDWPEAERVNGISMKMVLKKPMFAESAAEIQQIMNTVSVVIGYNTLFDLDFLASYGIEWNHLEDVVDVMMEYSPDRWVKLTEAANQLGYDWKDTKAHDALADCYATLFVHENMYGVI